MKISVIIVSHSKSLAIGLKDILEEISKNTVKIIAIGGINGLLGTDSDAIISAIQNNINNNYILIFCDIGSTILSTKVIIDSYFQEYKDKIILVNAPMVEGSIAMTAQLASGSTLEMALDEAKNSYNLKIADTNYNNEIQLDKQDMENVKIKEFKTYEFLIKNRYGLHARPVAKLIAICNKFDNEILIRNETTSSEFANSKSMSQVLSLNIKKGDKILISISTSNSNPDIIFSEIKNFLEKLESEEENINQEIKLSNSKFEHGRGVSPGIAIGRVFHFNLIEPDVPVYNSNVNKEIKKFDINLNNILKEFKEQKEFNDSQYVNDINNMYISILEDYKIIENVHEMIKNGYSAAFSWNETIKNFIESLENTGNEYFMERIIDFNGIRVSMLKKLCDINLNYNIKKHSIIIADDIPSSFLANVSNENVAGLISIKGSTTSHATLLARAKGIPYIINAPKSILNLKNSDTIAINGETGEIFVNPDNNLIKELNRIKLNTQTTMASNNETKDGIKILVLANISCASDAIKAKMYNAQGIGLFRTEFVFMNRDSPPSINEQINIYLDMSSKFQDYQVIIRLLDAGADKPIKYINQSKEQNPQLGTRGVRLLLKNINILRDQLKSIVLANQKYGNIDIMIPMVSTYDEVYSVKTELNQIINNIQKNTKEKIKIPKLGIMIETPAAIMELDKLYNIIDFVSIGTNDLTQYVYAIDRTGPDYNEGLSVSPPLLKFIYIIIQKCKKYNIDVSVCGGIASNKDYIHLLLGAGIRKLSVDPVFITSIKTKIQELKINKCEEEFKKLIS